MPMTSPTTQNPAPRTPRREGPIELIECSLYRLEGGTNPDRGSRGVLFLDIDGTVRKGKDELGKFVNLPSDVEVFSEVPPLLAHYRELGYYIVGITNQGGIALGYVSRSNAVSALWKTDLECGYRFDLMLFCPDGPSDVEGRASPYRKPRAGMFFESIRRLHRMMNPMGHSIDLWTSLYVGDRKEDIQFALQAGVPYMDAKEWRSKDPEEVVQGLRHGRLVEGLRRSKPD